MSDNDLRTSIYVLRDYLFELLRKWYWFLLLGALALLAASYYVQKLRTVYRADASLMISADGGGGISGILRMAGQFGFGGGSGGAELSSDKIIDLLASRQIVYSALLTKVSIDKKDDLLVNHFLRLSQPNKKQPISNTTIDKLTTAENEVMSGIYDGFTKGGQLTSNVGTSGIIHSTLTLPYETLAKETLETIVTTLQSYYADKSVEQQRRTYQIINSRVDSLEKALYSTEYNLAHFVDQYRPALQAGTLTAQKLMSQDQLKRQAEILNVMYSEAVRNREIAQMTMLSSQEMVQIIDKPRYPLIEQQPSIIIVYALALFFTIAIVTILVVLNKLIRDALKTD